MDATRIAELACATQDGTLAFASIVAALRDEGVESYRVDYRAACMTFHGADTGIAIAPLTLGSLPEIAREPDVGALRAAIRDSQAHGQSFADFSRRATQAGVQVYYAFLRGQRVTYLGRTGDAHVEWFPGAAPEGDPAARSDR